MLTTYLVDATTRGVHAVPHSHVGCHIEAYDCARAVLSEERQTQRLRVLLLVQREALGTAGRAKYLRTRARAQDAQFKSPSYRNSAALVVELKLLLLPWLMRALQCGRG